jgi:hypothetical protein
MFPTLARGASKAAQLGIPKPLRAIRLKCLDCTCGSDTEIRSCQVTSCALFPYRMGKYPKVGDRYQTVSKGRR